jgi:hypothetical protein
MSYHKNLRALVILYLPDPDEVTDEPTLLDAADILDRINAHVETDPVST